MIGTKLYKNNTDDMARYTEIAMACNKAGNLTIEDKGEYYEVVEIPAPSLDELKTAKLQEAGSLFAQKRDSIRFIQLDETRKYGFDCANEDVTNFMASYMPLLIMRGGTTEYKVYLDETDLDNKKLVELSFEDMNKTYSEVSTDQKKAYKWYEVVKAQVNACTTKEELEAIVW